MKITRRQFLKGAVATGIGMALPLKFGVGTAQAFANSGQLTKWAQDLRGLGPTGIPTLTPLADTGIFSGGNFYQVTVGEFTDQLYPATINGNPTGFGPTKLWGYWDTTNVNKKHLAGVVAIQRGTPARIRFTNALPTPHIIPVDTTLPGANQAQNRTATHIHGGLVPWISDGGPFDWFAPNADPKNATGLFGLSFLNGTGSLFDTNGPPMAAGQADYYYPNNQSTRLLWYHDHAHGITRINAYAGIASAYLIIDPANDTARLTANTPVTAGPNWIPLVFQDKIFVSATTPLTDPTWTGPTTIGSLWYAHVYDPKLYKLLTSSKFLAPPNPSVVPEFFADTMLVNGTVYPKLPATMVNPTAYRFMMLNACNARFLNINLFDLGPTATLPAGIAEVTTNPSTGFAAKGTVPGPLIYQIGTEGGYLAADVVHPGNTPVNPATMTGNLLLAPAERADVVIDFSQFAGHTIIMYNDAPAPFPGGAPTNDYYLGNRANPVQPLAGTGPDTRNILRIDVGGTVNGTANIGPFLNPITIPATPTSTPNLDPPVIAQITTTVAPIPPLAAPAGTFVRDLTLNEDFDQYGRLRQTIGTTAPNLVGGGYGLEYLAPPTEVVTAGNTEVWRLFNLTADTHPIHFHLVNVQILSRQPFKVSNGVFLPTGAARGPDPEELGWKETVRMNPGEVTSVIMKFDLPAGLPFTVPPSPRTGKNEYVFHCHILEHEEHDMMRPLIVDGTGVNLDVQPPNATIGGKFGGAVQYVIGGGTKPYRVTSSNPAIVPVLAASGDRFSVNVKNNTVPQVVSFTVIDSAAHQVVVTLTIV